MNDQASQGTSHLMFVVLDQKGQKCSLQQCAVVPAVYSILDQGYMMDQEYVRDTLKDLLVIPARWQKVIRSCEDKDMIRLEKINGKNVWEILKLRV